MATVQESLNKKGSYFSVRRNYMIITYVYKMFYINLNICNIQLEDHIAFKGEKSHIQYDYYVDFNSEEVLSYLQEETAILTCPCFMSSASMSQYLMFCACGQVFYVVLIGP